MWRPRSTIGVAWRGKRGSSTGAVGPGGCGGAACGGGAGGGGLPAFLSGGGRGITEREEEDDRLDLFANSEKFRGPFVKQK